MYDTTGQHLYEIDHPYYAAKGYPSTFDTFAELRDAADRLDEDMNYIYRWDWADYSQSHYDDYGLTDAARAKQKLTVSFVLQRKSQFMTWTCPVTHDDEPTVREWLAGPRVLGHLRKTWAPLLDA